MTKKRVTIYIDDGVLIMGKDAAWEGRLNFSKWVEGLIRVSLVSGVRTIVPREAVLSDMRIEPGAVIEVDDVGDDALLRKSSLFQRDGDKRVDAQITEGLKGQAKLDSERAKRDVKKEKIAKVKSSGYFNPQPKGGAK